MSDRTLPPLERADVVSALSKASSKLWALGPAIEGLTRRLGADDDADALMFILVAAQSDLDSLNDKLRADHRGEKQ